MDREILNVFCAVLPGALMAAAHWFPWQRAIRRRLHRLEAYSIGTVAIVGVSLLAILASDGDKFDHARYLVLAAVSAGLVTLAAWAIDAWAEQRIRAFEARRTREVSDELESGSN